MAKFKQISVKRSSGIPQGNRDIINQGSRGSNRGGRIQEIGNIKSKNYIPGEQGWSFGPDFVEMRLGNLTIDSETPQILLSDGTNDRVLLGFQEGGF